MNKRILLPLMLIGMVLTSPAFSQNDNYFAAGGDMIFSSGPLESDTTDTSPVLRWSPFFNVQGQLHFGFSEHVGFYTGLGVRNVGLISHVTSTFLVGGIPTQEEITVKERSYSLGLPLALKFGNIPNETYFAAGGEAELMFSYKRKIMDDGNKVKNSGWFNDNVNIFNPSVFGEMHFHGGQYIRFKYYLMDFLNYQGINLVDDSQNQKYVADYGSGSPLFYVSVGIVTSTAHLEQEIKTPTDKTSYFKSKKKDWKDIDSASK